MKLQGAVGPTKIEVQIGNFNNPPTTKDITGVSAFLIGSNGLAKSITRDGIITGFLPAYMIVASTKSSSLKVGDSGQTLTVSFTTITTMKSGYQIYMATPRWNPQSSSQQWMIKSDTPACTTVSGLTAGALNCAFDSSTGILSLSNPTGTDLPGGTPISFTVTNFQNPYNGVPKSGFIATIFDPVTEGKVDETVSMSVTCTEFTELLSPTL